MPDTAKRVETMMLLGKLRRDNEMPGNTQLRALRTLLACDRLGSWMSAALDDPNVCAAMKANIQAWFDAQY